MNTDKLKAMAATFEKIKAQRLEEERRVRILNAKAEKQQFEKSFASLFSDTGLQALREAGFTWTGFPLAETIVLQRQHSLKTLDLEVSGHHIRWSVIAYDMTTPEGELDLLSEIAFQFGI